MIRDRVGRWASSLGAGAAVMAVLVTGGGAAAAASGGTGSGRTPVVVTTGGAVRGKQAGAVEEFLGIPYAAPPLGPLRWRAPQPAASWTGVREGTAFAPHCLQPASPLGGGVGAEDCLYLNVFAPAGARTAHRPRPVMVWIHGGGLVTGESEDYDPAPLVRHGVVVVTINYRLGVLGFLAHPALAGRPGGPSGDYGLMDHQAALRWVRRNAGRFGGDPGDVTVFGESAGGLSVLSQLVSPGGRGLFQRAVVESGAYNLTQAPLATAEAAGEAFAASAGCADQSAACLRGLSTSDIVAHTDAAGYRPNIDGLVLTRSLGAAFASGQFNRVPVVNGTNHDEYRLFVAIAELRGSVVTAANYRSTIGSVFGVPDAVAATIAAQYPLAGYPSPAIALGAAGTDAIFACPALTVDDAVSRYAPVYAYEFNDETAPQPLLPPVSFPYGAAHASELQYLFGLPTAPFPAPLSPVQERLAAAMTSYWTHFAALAVPSAFGTPPWPRYAEPAPRVQSLVPPVPHTETGFAAAHRCAFWSGL